MEDSRKTKKPRLSVSPPNRVVVINHFADFALGKHTLFVFISPSIHEYTRQGNNVLTLEALEATL